MNSKVLTGCINVSTRCLQNRQRVTQLDNQNINNKNRPIKFRIGEKKSKIGQAHYTMFYCLSAMLSITYETQLSVN